LKEIFCSDVLFRDIRLEEDEFPLTTAVITCLLLVHHFRALRGWRQSGA